MQVTPESKSVLDLLLTGRRIDEGTIQLGPLDNVAQSVLRILMRHYDGLLSSGGKEQTRSLLAAYQESVSSACQQVDTKPPLKQDKAKDSTPDHSHREKGITASSIANCDTPPKWRLHELRCCSIKGVAPFGEQFSFSFNGNSMLLYGPNGSGKSSLLGAIVWVLTGLTISDAPEETEKASIHKISKEPKRGTKICDWPIICTLPEHADPASLGANCVAVLDLKTADEKRSLRIRRTLEKGLEIQTDDLQWQPLADLSCFGITPLDLQLSVVAPTTFGRQAIENATDSRRVLSLMLGFDALEDLGNLATNLGRNRTLLLNSVRESLEADRDKLKIRLNSLSDITHKNTRVFKLVLALQHVPKLSQDHLKRTRSRVACEIEKSRTNIARVLGVTDNCHAVPPDLEDNLIKALNHLEEGFPCIFPAVSEIAPHVILPPKEGLTSQKQVTEIEQSLGVFLGTAPRRIAERLDWWRQEVAPASKAKLLLLAAQSYDSAQMKCPVCEQSIKEKAIKGQLESLKGRDPRLLDDLKSFFRNLTEELDGIVSEKVRSLASSSAEDRLASDWEAMKDRKEWVALKALTNRFDEAIGQLSSTTALPKAELPQLFPDDADPAFFLAAQSFVAEVNAASKAILMAQWAASTFHLLKKELCDLLTAPATANKLSLFAILSEGKAGVEGIRPLKNIETQLSEMETSIAQIAANQGTLDALNVLKEPLDELKKLSKYATDKTVTIFGDVKDKAIENWRLLYPESCTCLYPSRLVMAGRGGDKSVESLLTQGSYEVPSPPFANAGLQRALALSFLRALLDRHPRGLDFILFDDPILSLDEDHRERWAEHLLFPLIEDQQVILATHQRQFLTNCSDHFHSGEVVELNPRNHKTRISFQPGNLIAKARTVLGTNWEQVPGILYNYCEQVMMTLDAYCSPSAAFFDAARFEDSLRTYEGLQPPHILASKHQRQIVASLRNPKVRNPTWARHEAEKVNVTRPMVADALVELDKLNDVFAKEVKRLRRLCSPHRRHAPCHVMPSNIPLYDAGKVFAHPLTISVLGRAAARPDDWVIDEAEEPTFTKFAPEAAICALSQTLDPVVRYGQCVLLESHDVLPDDGDLVAVSLGDGRTYLRRLWSDGEEYILFAIHPTRPATPIRVPKGEALVRKGVGVLYEPPTASLVGPPGAHCEWQAYDYFPPQTIESLRTLLVEGDSLDPIARPGQKVLVGEGKHPSQVDIEDGGLAAVETKEESIGNVIKRVFRRGEEWVLVSPNPVEPRRPDTISIAKIECVWPLRGVLFETTD